MKQFVEWTDQMSVGIQEIDEQHKQLVDLINRLYDLIVHPNKDKTAIREILNGLVQYTVIHFAVEESLFRIFNYPNYEIHKKRHEELRQQVMEINEIVQRGEKEVTVELLVFLRKWLRDHIMIEDKHYAPFLIKQGIKKTWEQRSWVGKIWDSIH